MIRIGVIGCGTVGSGLIKLLRDNGELINKRAGCTIELKKAVDIDIEKMRGLKLGEGVASDDVNQILNNPDINIVVELIGGLEPAYQYIMTAMENGKHVVTANKDLIAARGEEIFKKAEEMKVGFFFEASVAGGIPVIYPLKRSLAGNRIQEVIGILNGTTNYILTKMSMEGRSLPEVLKEAQAKGYAESDPSADVNGLDAARKIAILASIAFNHRIIFDDVYVEGIMNITSSDIHHAKALGYVIKLLAIAKEDEQGQIQVRVHPTFISKDHPLATVNDVYNSVFIRGDAVGDIMLYGRGAGQMPTASAVMGDVIEVGRNIVQSNNLQIDCTCFEESKVIDISQLYSPFYIRMTVRDQPGVLAGIAGVFGNNRVSLSTVLQPISDGNWAELILITHEVKEQDLQSSLQILRGMSIVQAINSVIRVKG